MPACCSCACCGLVSPLCSLTDTGLSVGGQAAQQEAAQKEQAKCVHLGVIKGASYSQELLGVECQADLCGGP